MLQFDNISLDRHNVTPDNHMLVQLYNVSEPARRMWLPGD